MATESSNPQTLNAADAPTGDMGQKYLATGESVALRLWQEEPTDPKPEQARPYETVGYVIEGRGELLMGGNTIPLTPGDSWVVPKGIAHTYRILESFRAVEATSPPARVGDRDEP
ncbi:MAG: cupin domain-containing protein [Elainellaceae cyanobacterium]